MKQAKILSISSKAFIIVSILSLAYVAMLSMLNPRATMNLVGVSLPNTDALSSIRGVYGGVGLTIVISLIYLLIKDILKALAFLTLFWGFYALSRFITIAVDGPLGDFGSQWSVIEMSFCILAGSLFIWQGRLDRSKNVVFL